MELCATSCVGSGTDRTLLRGGTELVQVGHGLAGLGGSALISPWLGGLEARGPVLPPIECLPTSQTQRMARPLSFQRPAPLRAAVGFGPELVPSVRTALPPFLLLTDPFPFK